jgi:hypothetical protein
MSTGERFSPHAARLIAERYADVSAEKQYAQTFWRDIFTDLALMDTFSKVEFEYPVRSHVTNTIKFIDVLWPGVVLIEHKSRGSDLDKAEEQAREYLQSLDSIKRTPVIIVSDFARIRIIDTLAGTTVEFALSELPDNVSRFEAIIGSRGLGATHQEATADTQAANLMAELFLAFEKAGYTGHETSVFLVRILFLMFAEDSRMMRRTIFTTYVLSSPEDGTGLGAMLQELFEVLNTPKVDRRATISSTLEEFPYVNGGIFRETLPLFSFTPDMRKALTNACSYRWDTISPQIFGSLFQSVRDPETRRQMGEHYTSETFIMRVISDLFLDDFTKRMLDAWDSPTQLTRLRNELGLYTWLDPACGSGNFLIVAFRRMRSLELRMIARQQELEGKPWQPMLDGSWGVQVHLGQFHGIEIDEWSSAIARVGLHLANHQANLEFEEITGAAPNPFPLSESGHIIHANALRTDWNEVCPLNEKTFIMGNPPFYGSTFQSKEQKEDSRLVWQEAKGWGQMDFVTNWFILASRYMAKHGGQTAFVATNSITQGEQPAVLWGQMSPLNISIDFAHRTFAWANDATGQAAVHVVILGFSLNRNTHKKNLWDYPDIKAQPVLRKVERINAYLLDAADVLIHARTTPLGAGTPIMDNGSKPTDAGHLSDISAEEAEIIRATDPIAAKYLRRIMGARELIQGLERWCLWMPGISPTEIRQSNVLTQRVSAVKEMREKSSDQQTKKDATKAWEFQKIRQPSSNFVAVPRVSSEKRQYVPMAWLDKEMIINDSLQAITGSPLWMFGIVSSRPFNVWNKAVSGRLESRVRISASITYNTFPFPSIEPLQKSKIEEAAQQVIDARLQFPDNTLSDLYDSDVMPTQLRKAHDALDKAVLAAFGLRGEVSDGRILEILFENYTEATSGLFHQPKTVRKLVKKID